MSVSSDAKLFLLEQLCTFYAKFFFFLFLSGTLLKYFGARAQPTPPTPDVSTIVSASTADDTAAGEVFLDGKWLHSLLIWHDTFNIVFYLFICLFIYLIIAGSSTAVCLFIYLIIAGSSTAELLAPESEEQLTSLECEEQLPALTLTDTSVSTSAGMTGQLI